MSRAKRQLEMGKIANHIKNLDDLLKMLDLMELQSIVTKAKVKVWYERGAIDNIDKSQIQEKIDAIVKNLVIE